jgi:hypothetical protein
MEMVREKESLEHYWMSNVSVNIGDLEKLQQLVEDKKLFTQPTPQP